VRTVERWLGILTLTLAAAWAMYVLGLGSDAGITVPVLLTLVYGGGAILILWCLRLGAHILITRRAPEQRRLLRLLLAPCFVVACVAAVWTGVAFRIRFLLSKPALERFIRHPTTVERRADPPPPARVGLFWLREVEVLPGGVVRIITTPCMFDDCGVVYSPRGLPPIIGEDHYRPLAGAWHHWWRSW
jgi:hypothetical protein